jgi:arylsulfatase A-like enzyme
LIGEANPDKGGESIQKLVEKMSFSDNEFLFLNLMEAHTPYDPPKEYRTIDLSQYDTDPQTPFKSDVDFDALRQGYDDCVRYLSDIYQQIFETLRAKFDVVLTVSDHGELLGEHDIWAHWYGIYPELVHVPLVVWQEGGSSTVRQNPVSLLDVYETVCDAAGIDSRGDGRGKSLLDPPTERTYLVESHGLREEDRERMDNCGMANSKIERYDRELRGIVMPPDYYGFENDRRFVEQGSTSLKDPQDEIGRQLSELDIRETTGENHEDVSGDMRKRLENMGYL